MIKKILVFAFLILSINTVFAFEDCIIVTNGKLTDIKIENNQIIDVFPLITIMNDKNTLFVHPLKEGETKFSVLKNKKEKFVFEVKVENNKTLIKDVEGFSILSIDEPPQIYEYDLDLPPMVIK